jgi:hypothetical protein
MCIVQCPIGIPGLEIIFSPLLEKEEEILRTIPCWRICKQFLFAVHWLVPNLTALQIPPPFTSRVGTKFCHTNFHEIIGQFLFAVHWLGPKGYCKSFPFTSMVGAKFRYIEFHEIIAISFRGSFWLGPNLAVQIVLFQQATKHQELDEI